MKKCEIKIRSQGDGWEQNIHTQGECVPLPDGFRFDYTLDGDSCILTVKGKEVVQKRRGTQNINMYFCEGKGTQCTLSHGGLSGGFNVYTSEIFFTHGQICKLSMRYSLGEEQIHFTFTANIG